MKDGATPDATRDARVRASLTPDVRRTLPKDHPQAMTPFELSEQTMRDVGNLVDRVRSVTSRLCGSMPMAIADTEGPFPTEEGALVVLERQLRTIRRLVDEAHQELQRIEANLP